MLTTAGFPVPTTVRDLSELYLTWGLASREETPDGTRWSMPAVLPLPGDLVPLDPELTERLDKLRWTMRTGPLLDTLIDHLVNDLGEPAEALTSLDRLAAATGQDVDDVPARSRGTREIRRRPCPARRGAGRRGASAGPPPLPPGHGLGALPRQPHPGQPRVTEAAHGTVGTSDMRLIVLRGNSASGKSSVAAGLREKFGRNLAIVAQDNLRRIALRERDRPGGANIGLIDLTARYALDNGFHVVVEGILYADRYGTMLQNLVRAHQGVTRCYYLHVPFEETVLRHATKPDAEYLAHVNESHLRGWYREKDLLPGGLETVIDAASTLDDTVQQILSGSGLDGIPPIDR